MTDAEIAEIRARADAATAGPWEATLETWGSADGRPSAIRIEGVAGSFLYDDEAEAEQQRKNYAFMAHARADIPTLLAEVARLTAERDALIRLYARPRPFGSLGPWQWRRPDGFDHIAATEEEARAQILAAIQPTPEVPADEPRGPYTDCAACGGSGCDRCMPDQFSEGADA